LAWKIILPSVLLVIVIICNISLWV
jgi:hypothetical protein